MKSCVGFWGILFSLTLDFSQGNRSEIQECGNKYDSCEEKCLFCDTSFPSRAECYKALVESCLSAFHLTMISLDTDFCSWEGIKRPYHVFSQCTEDNADCLKIPWPNQLVEHIFVEIHSNYFWSCAAGQFCDPPPFIIFVLVMIPISLIPVMVTVVVMKTKNGDSGS